MDALLGTDFAAVDFNTEEPVHPTTPEVRKTLV